MLQSVEGEENANVKENKQSTLFGFQWERMGSEE
jgi:hypothetical protein